MRDMVLILAAVAALKAACVLKWFWCERTEQKKSILESLYIKLLYFQTGYSVIPGIIPPDHFILGKR